MREILFRAKRIDNEEWVEGYYYAVNYNEYTEHNISFSKSSLEPFARYKINPDTLGQYIGLTDKKGNKIFEGDIVKCENYHGEVTGCISWIRGCGFYLKCTCGYSDEYLLNCKNIKIIGNIHDNPELLKTEGE